MGSRNSTNVPDLVLMGLPYSEETLQVIFILFLLIYLITLLENARMIVIICLDLQLHTPMYFFLSHLSFLDLSYSTVITPTTLGSLLTSNKCISFINSFNQMSFFLFLAVTEFFFLFSMAHDHYCLSFYFWLSLNFSSSFQWPMATVCQFLHYLVALSKRLCCTLITGAYMIGFIESLFNLLCMNSLCFCDSSVVYCFYCGTTLILALTCTDTREGEVTIIIVSSLNIMVSIITISVSYRSTLSTILKINPTSGKHKTFSTCTSHLLGVTIYYGCTVFTCLKPRRSCPLGKDQVASVFYTIVIPMLNPLIYSLTNKEVKNAFIRIMKRGVYWQQK